MTDLEKGIDLFKDLLEDRILYDNGLMTRKKFLQKYEDYPYLDIPIIDYYGSDHIITSADYRFDETLEERMSEHWWINTVFKFVNDKYPNEFKPGKVTDNKMTLLRINESHCCISGKLHDKENSYIIINETSVSYKISIGCNRGCVYSTRNIKLKGIGSIKKL